jgi:hypothetical protein
MVRVKTAASHIDLNQYGRMARHMVSTSSTEDSSRSNSNVISAGNLTGFLEK